MGNKSWSWAERPGRMVADNVQSISLAEHWKASIWTDACQWNQRDQSVLLDCFLLLDSQQILWMIAGVRNPMADSLSQVEVGLSRSKLIQDLICGLPGGQDGRRVH